MSILSGMGVGVDRLKWLVYDEFTDSDGVGIGSHAPIFDVEGGGYVNVANSPQINSNQMLASGLSRWRIDCGTPYQIVSARVMPMGSFCRLNLRQGDATHKMGCLFRDDTNQILLYWYNGGGANAFGGVAYTFTTGYWYDFDIIYGSDNLVTVIINGAIVLYKQDEGGNVPLTGVYFDTEFPDTWRFDDLRIVRAS